MNEGLRTDPRTRTVSVLVRSLGRTACALLATVLLILPSSVTGLPADCIDQDGDGYGAFGDPSCPAGSEVDCDDTNGAVFPGAPEICDGVANDCDQPNPTEWWSESLVLELSDTYDWTSMAAGDIDGDGDIDVVRSSKWYENAAGNGFVWIEHSTYDGGYSASFGSSVSVADMDGDDDLDVLAGGASWRENVAGDGSVWIAHGFAFGADFYPAGLAADMDGDGDLDVLSVGEVTGGHYETNSQRVTWYENTAGDGSDWVSHTIRNLASRAYTSLSASDVDGDGDIDLLWKVVDCDFWGGCQFNPEVQWLENRAGDGSNWSSYVIAEEAAEFLPVDVDGDHDLDLLAHGDFNSWWYENAAGDGTVWTSHVIPSPNILVTSMAAADVDGDSDLDVLLASHEDQKISWLENGASWDEHPVVGAGAREFNGMVPADVNGDGRVDVLAPSGNPRRIQWFYQDAPDYDSDGDGVSECMGDCDDANANCTDDCETDLDGDGVPYCTDTCVDQDGDNHGDPGGAGNSCSGPDCDDDSPHCALECTDADQDLWCVDQDCSDGDLNNWVSCATCADADGDSYFVGCDAYSTIDGPDCDDGNGDVYPGGPEVCDGANNDCDHPDWPDVDWWTEHQIETGGNAWSVYVADVDGDGDLDVVSAWHYDDTIAWHENAAGDGSAWVTHPVSWLTDGPSAVFATDMNGDGAVDVLAAYYNDDKIVWYQNELGDGTSWTERVVSTSVEDAGAVYAADLDGDDDVDIVSVASGWPRTNDAFMWHENVFGAGVVWIDRAIAAPVHGARAVFAVDLDGDDDMDVVSAASDYPYAFGQLAWYENAAGDGTVWVEQSISTSASYIQARTVIAADVDGDGDVDVVTGPHDDAGIAWYENATGTGSLMIEHLIATSVDEIVSLFAADMDGDGDLDLLSASDYPDEIAWYENLAGDGSVWDEHVILELYAPYAVFAADVDGDGRTEVVVASSTGVAWCEPGSVEGDLDGDGLAYCEGDCDDDATDVYAGAPEINDGVDNQCPGDDGHGLIDEIEGESGFHDPENRDEYSWPSQPGATSYEVARFAAPANPVSCTTFVTADSFVIDPEEPVSGSIFHYLVRALAPNIGSWGADSAGNERTNVCP